MTDDTAALIEPSVWIGFDNDGELFVTRRREVADAWNGAVLASFYSAADFERVQAERDEWFREAEDRANSCSLILRRAEAAEAQLLTLQAAVAAEREA